MGRSVAKIIIILNFGYGIYKNKNIDHQGKENCASEKDHVSSLRDSTTPKELKFCFRIRKMFICEISIIIILICQKLGSVGPVQQKIKCSSPNTEAHNTNN